jgi:hypothetical protein
MSYDVTLLVFGILLLLVGLVGKIRAKELECGTENTAARVVIACVGVLLILASLNPDVPRSLLPSKAQEKQGQVARPVDGSERLEGNKVAGPGPSPSVNGDPKTPTNPKIDPSDSQPAAAAVVLHNNTQSTIAHVYFGTVQWGGWSGEQLSDPIPPGGSHNWPRLQPGAGIYDLKAEDGDHNLLDQQVGVRIRGTDHWYVRDKP